MDIDSHPDVAQQVLERVADTQSDDISEANFKVAMAYRNRNNYYFATMYMFRAIEVDPSARNFTCIGKLFSEVKNFVAAEHYFQKALSTDPKYALAHHGLLSMGNGDPPVAEATDEPPPAGVAVT